MHALDGKTEEDRRTKVIKTTQTASTDRRQARNSYVDGRDVKEKQLTNERRLGTTQCGVEKWESHHEI